MSLSLFGEGAGGGLEMGVLVSGSLRYDIEEYNFLETVE